MGVRNQNSTNYVHPDEPNLLNLHKAMQYNNGGEPQVRVHVDGISLEGDVIVDKVKLWDGTNNLVFDQPNNDSEASTVWSLPVENYNMVFNGSTWDRMRGNTTDGVLVKLSNGSIAVTGSVNVAGTVELGSASLSALENINATVSGTVTVQDGGGSITVDGTVNISTMPEVEIKNDIGNPIPVEWVYGDGSTIIPWEVQVARGLIPGVTGLSISGYNSAVDTTYRPLWHYGDRSYTYLSSAQVVRVWSSSASDTNVSVLITGLDSNYVLQTETVVLTNGVTGVLSTKEFLRVNSISLTRTPMNAGLITVGSSDKTIELAHIEINAGRSQMTVYTVPAGYTFYLTQSQWYTNNTGNNTALYRSYTQSPTGLINTVLTFPFPTTYNSLKVVPRPYPEKTDIQWQASSNSGTTRIGGQIEGHLIQNGL